MQKRVWKENPRHQRRHRQAAAIQRYDRLVDERPRVLRHGHYDEQRRGLIQAEARSPYRPADQDQPKSEQTQKSQNDLILKVFFFLNMRKTKIPNIFWTWL